MSRSRCSVASPGHVGGLAPPPRLGPASQRPQAGAGRVDEHPVVRVGLGRADLPAVAGPDGDLTRAAPGDHGGQRPADQVGPVRVDLVGDQVGVALQGQAREQSGLAARAGTQVEPALPAGAALDRRRGEGQGDQLRPLVLHGGSSLAHGRDRPRVPVVEDDGGPGQRGRARRRPRAARSRRPVPGGPRASPAAARCPPPGARRAARPRRRRSRCRDRAGPAAGRGPPTRDGWSARPSPPTAPGRAGPPRPATPPGRARTPGAAPR